MDAVEFLKERSRMCEMYGKCECCELVRGGCNCMPYETGNPEKVVEIVEKWSKDNPAYTYYDEFCKRFPKHKYLTFNHLAVNLCVNSLFGTEYDCRKFCDKCWKQEYKGE